ncbi:MAG: SCO family protein [Melioribacteraceae bacterium]|jgi:protein SCO1/2|nr:SCO family protein [Melioribacteraceae bacterium]
MLKKTLNTFLLLKLITAVTFSQQINVGIDEKLGDYLPKDAIVVTSDNDTVKLGSLINKPLILAFVYYECPGLCNPLQSEIAWIIGKMDLVPGVDYKVISLSFDHHEKSEIAARWKNNYIPTIKRKIDPNDWLFLTADSININKITQAAGFYFKPDDKEFTHAGAIIAISPEGKISRYIFGTQYNPFDVKMALLDAGSGKTKPTINKVLEFCFSYDPEGRQYTLNVTRIIGTVMLLGVGIFFGVLLFKKKKNSMNEGADING